MELMINNPMLDMAIPVATKAMCEEPTNPYLKFLVQWLADAKRLLSKEPDLDDEDVYIDVSERIVECLHKQATDVEMKALRDNRVVDAIKIADFRSSAGSALLMDLFHGKGW